MQERFDPIDDLVMRTPEVVRRVRLINSWTGAQSRLSTQEVRTPDAHRDSGGNDFEVEDKNIRYRQPEGNSPKSVAVDRPAFKEAFDRRRGGMALRENNGIACSNPEGVQTKDNALKSEVIQKRYCTR